MKTKKQILEAIKRCSKMGKRGEQACCSKCPYKKDVFCNIHLLNDLKWYVVNDVSSFIDYLKDNHDGSILNEDGTETVMQVIDVATLDKKYKEFSK